MIDVSPASTINVFTVWADSLPEVLRAAADRIEELATEQAEDGMPPCYQTFYLSGPTEYPGPGGPVKPDHWGLSYCILVSYE
jgi:hypothetical protein